MIQTKLGLYLPYGLPCGSIDDLVQKRHNSSALAMEFCFFCIKPLTCLTMRSHEMLNWGNLQLGIRNYNDPDQGLYLPCGNIDDLTRRPLHKMAAILADNIFKGMHFFNDNFTFSQESNW